MAQERRDEVEECRRDIPRECVGGQCWCADDVWRVYERLVEDWRRYDAILWQLPFGTMTAVGVILTLAFYYIPSSEYGVRVALFFALAWFTFVMMHVSYKVRHFQIERSVCAEAIERECLRGFAVPYDTEGAEKYVFREEIRRNLLRPLERGFYEVKSYHLVYTMYIGMIYVLLLFAFIELPHVGLRVAAICAAVVTIVLVFIIICIGWLQRRRREKRGNKDGKRSNTADPRGVP
jgi:uncharacterized membrane protein